MVAAKDSPSVGILASVAEFGIASKPNRGVEARIGHIPNCLSSSLQALNRFTQRHAIDANAAPAQLAAVIEKALTPQSIAPKSDNDHDLSM